MTLDDLAASMAGRLTRRPVLSRRAQRLLSSCSFSTRRLKEVHAASPPSVYRDHYYARTT